MTTRPIPVYRSLAWRLALWMLLFSLMVTLCESVYQLHSQYNDFLNDKKRELQELGEVNLPSLANAVWNMDSRALDILLDGLRQLPDVELVEVWSEDKLLASTGSETSHRRLERTYPLAYEFRAAPRTLGKLRVVLDLDRGWSTLWREAVFAVVMETLRTLVLAFALLLIFYFLVGRHLRRVAVYASGLTASGLDRPLVLDRSSAGKRGWDELDQLGTALESMRESLAGYIGELREANVNLRQEVSLRQDAQQEVLATRAFLRDIVDSMPSGVIGLSGGLLVTHCNDMASKLAGKSPEEVLGRPLEQAFPPLAGFIGLMRQAIEQRQPVIRRRLSLEMPGTTMIASLVVYPLTSETQEGVVVRLDDETQMVRLEEVLIQSEKMASLGSLAAGMAHEINNPLSGVLHSAQSITRRLTPGLPANDQAAAESGFSMEALSVYLKARGILQLLDGVRSSGERAARIVANMLKFSRRSQQRHAPQNLPEIMDAALELAQSDYDMKKQYDFKQISIERHYDPDLPPVPCSAQEIEQVILNLLKNAAQAMADQNVDAPYPVLTLSIYREQDQAVMSVRDNGPGMDEEVRRRVFEPFFTTKEQGVGTGLGLAVSYFIVSQNHGGSIEVESSPGKGATFVVRLPIEDTAQSVC